MQERPLSSLSSIRRGPPRVATRARYQRPTAVSARVPCSSPRFLVNRRNPSEVDPSIASSSPSSPTSRRRERLHDLIWFSSRPHGLFTLLSLYGAVQYVCQGWRSPIIQGIVMTEVGFGSRASSADTLQASSTSLEFSLSPALSRRSLKLLIRGEKE